MQIATIQSKIYPLRDHRIMLDFDLAELYKVETRVLNQSVKRNIKRFPKNFMFQLTAEEWQTMSSQFVMAYSSNKKSNSSQFVMSSRKHRGIKYLPYAFTEHGVTMLASVLNSDHAIKMNIAIVNAFVALREFAMNYSKLAGQIEDIRQRVNNHSEQLNLIYEAIENMLDEKVDEKKPKKRNPIGFKIKKTKKTKEEVSQIRSAT